LELIPRWCPATVGDRTSAIIVVYCSPVADIIAHHGVHALPPMPTTRSSISLCTTTHPLSVFAECRPTTYRCHADCSTCTSVYSSTRTSQARSDRRRNDQSTACGDAIRAVSVSVAGVDLPVDDDMKVLGIVLDRRLTFHKHVWTVERSCNCHTLAIRHIWHLLTTELAQTLACSLILSRIDYCNAVCHDAPNYSIKKLQRVQNNAGTRLESFSITPRRYTESCTACPFSSGSTMKCPC